MITSHNKHHYHRANVIVHLSTLRSLVNLSPSLNRDLSSTLTHPPTDPPSPLQVQPHPTPPTTIEKFITRSVALFHNPPTNAEVIKTGLNNLFIYLPFVYLFIHSYNRSITYSCLFYFQGQAMLTALTLWVIWTTSRCIWGVQVSVKYLCQISVSALRNRRLKYFLSTPHAPAHTHTHTHTHN